jgi:prepilin-type N-terminal cleavage/methylation domain-containing protein
MTTRNHHSSGHTLAELLVVVAIFGTLAGVGLPALTRSFNRAGLRSATARVHTLLKLTREEAVTLNASRGIRFTKKGTRWVWAIYADGDRDGILNADILAGVDPLVYGPQDVGEFRGLADIGIPADGVRHPDDGTWLTATASPVRFNASSICSFSADGSSTPGSVYVCAPDGQAAIVRSSGDGGRIRVLFYDRGSQRWIQQ